MNIHTKYFGELSYSEGDALQFSDGLFGFEEEKEFVPIYFDESDHSILCLQSTQHPDLAFIIVNPFSIDPSYNPHLADEELAMIDATQDTLVAFFSVCVVRQPITDSTVNLRCPIVINTENNHAKQFILEDTSYSFKHPFAKNPQKEE